MNARSIPRIPAKLLLVATLGLAAIIMTTSPSRAQTGSGGGSVAVTRFAVVTEDSGWVLQVTLADTATGAGVTGWDVTIAGTEVSSGSTSEPIELTDRRGDGVYSAIIETQPGRWNIDVIATPADAAAGATPVTASFNASFPTAAGGSDNDAASTMAAIVGSLLLLILMLCLYAFFHRRRLIAKSSLPRRVRLLGGDEEGTLAPTLAAIVEQKLDEAPWKRRALASLGTKVVRIEVVDLDTAASLEVGPRTLTVHGDGGPPAQVTIRLAAGWVTAIVEELPQSLAHLPGLWTKAGRPVATAIARRHIRIQGLVRHPVLCVRVLQLLCVSPSSGWDGDLPDNDISDDATEDMTLELELEDSLWG